ncbi:Hypothetical protein A7982_00950 [Minicystis rosea]|nr:Hypothetical protein A7982_00950 [Minicystis rosea]
MKNLVSALPLLALSACAASTEPPPAPPPSPTAAPSAAPIATAAPNAPAAATSAEPGPADPPPLEIDYPVKGLSTIPDDCKEPSVVLTTAPKKMGWDYDWTWTRQAFFANPQFHIVDWPGKPERPMEVRLDMYAIPDGFALVGVCRDGATCNKLAAMYKSTVPTCSPKLHCGPLPIEGAPKRSAIIPANGQWLPTEDANVIGRCARIGVCLRMKHEPFRGNPGVVCQSAPTKMKIDCATKATCDEVVSCLR